MRKSQVEYSRTRYIGYFNHRVVALVTWVLLVSEANCISFLVVSSSFSYSERGKEEETRSKLVVLYN